jgi:hypothetical protein
MMNNVEFKRSLNLYFYKTGKMSLLTVSFIKGSG